ncbi:hypothetical protein C5L29_000659 [Lactiplantibacillus pentosus]|nr:hypothetical protein C5L29_000659 [Lactiplantibacillus pentosus]
MRQSTPVKKCLIPVFDGYLGYARFKISLLVATSITATNQPKKTASLRLTTAVKLLKNHSIPFVNSTRANTHRCKWFLN